MIIIIVVYDYKNVVCELQREVDANCTPVKWAFVKDLSNVNGSFQIFKRKGCNTVTL